MDALALLCTLYAEGPLTLARLRQADCSTIDAVLAADPRALASFLVSTQATAERFQREARNLGERVGTADTEIGSHSAGPSMHIKARPAVLDRVLAAWRERDERDADAGTASRPEIADAADEREEILQPALSARAVTQHLSREPKTPRTLAAGALSAGVLSAGVLSAGIVDGLDAEAATALSRAGVRDLRELAMCDTLAVARASGLSWSKLNRLRALAARGPGVLEKNDDAKRFDEADYTEEKISPSDRPLVEHAGLTQLEGAEQPAREVTEASRSRPKSTPQPMPTATTAPRYAGRAPEGAGGPFA